MYRYQSFDRVNHSAMVILGNYLTKTERLPEWVNSVFRKKMQLIYIFPQNLLY